MKVLCVGDIHGRHELVTQAFNTFLKGKYDKIIFHGDIADSYDRPDSDIIRCFNIAIAMKKSYSDSVELLIGNHDEQYLDPKSKNMRICPGYRPGLHNLLNAIVFPDKHLFRYAYGIGEYLFSHAGVCAEWYSNNYDEIDKWSEAIGVDSSDLRDLWRVLNAISKTPDVEILHEVGAIRGGKNKCGGPLWCDKSEMLTHGMIFGLHQVVGHTEQNHISRIFAKRTGKQVRSTSVTFIDVLANRPQFLTLEINDD